MNRMKITSIAANLHINNEQLKDTLEALGVEPIDETLSLSEVKMLMEYINVPEDPAQKSRNLLDHLVKNRLLFIDTCELMNDQFPALMDNLAPLMKQTGKQLLIPSRVEQELKNQFFHKDRQEKITTLLEYLETLESDDVIRVWGQDGENFADPQLLAIAAGALLSQEPAFITKDNALSEDLLKVNELESVHGKSVAVYRINKYGYLSRYRTVAERAGIA